MPWSQVIERRRWREVTQAGRQRLVQGFTVAAGQVQQPQQPGLPFDQGADRGPLVAADDEVALPVPRLGPVCGLEGSLVHRQHGLLKPGPPALDTLLRAPVLPPGPQR